jgi:hypothetical protein
MTGDVMLFVFFQSPFGFCSSVLKCNLCRIRVLLLQVQLYCVLAVINLVPSTKCRSFPRVDNNSIRLLLHSWDDAFVPSIDWMFVVKQQIC